MTVIKKFITIVKTFLVIIVIAMPFEASASEITSKNIIEQVNIIRQSQGLKKLELNPDLSEAAILKSNSMIERDYFEHYAYGLSPWVFIKNSGYDYQYAGENLAMDFKSSEGMVTAWMNSSTHRKNILSPNYEDIGVGIVKGAYTENGQSRETVMVTQMFGKKQSPFIVTASRALMRLVGIN